MFAFLSKFFLKKEIKLWAALPLSECKTVKPYLLERENITDGTAVMMAVPYFSRDCLRQDRNLSCYAVAEDYHLFFRDLFDELLPQLRSRFPQNRFAGFADHSPIAEVDAAARAGLGIIGKNRLLITEPYSSFVFLGTLVTDAAIPCEVHSVKTCENCNQCRSACPVGASSVCLSALTQKKGELTESEREAILTGGSVWGCDVCQLVCPHTKKALENGTIFSPIPFFSKNTVTRLTVQKLDGMTDAEFASRAYSWRGKATVRRNAELLNFQSEKGEEDA